MNNTAEIKPHITLRFVFSFISIVTFMLLSNHTFASSISNAIELYQQAEILYEKRRYQDALPIYKQAILEQKEDGEIMTNEVIDIENSRYGRTVKQTSKKYSTYTDYFPNARISSIEERLLEQVRLANPPKLSLQWIGLRDPSRDQILNGGETVTIVIDVHNTGGSDALEVALGIQLADSKHLQFDNTINIGTVPSKQNRTIDIEITVAKEIIDSDNNINIVATDKGGMSSNELDVAVITKTHRPAKLEFSEMDVYDLSNDTLIELGEPVTVTTRVINSGLGVAQAVVAHAELGENVYLGLDSQEKYQLGDIFPGEYRDFSFTFLTNGKFVDKQTIPVAISATENVNSGNHSIRRELHLSMRVPQKKVVISIDPMKSKENAQSSSPLAIDVDNNIPTTRTKNNNAVAVVIGNRNYRQATVPLVKYALNDAQIVKKYLINILGYNERNIIYLQDATSAKFNETFGSRSNYAGKLFNYIKPNKSDVFIYYSGHGAPDLKSKNAYFVPVDVDPAYVATSGYSLELFYRNLAKLSAKAITVVLDTCFSGNSSGGSVIPGIRPASIRLQITRPKNKNFTIFASSSADQISTWFSEKRHGLFTYYFLKGLRGFADSNNNSMITNSELGAYLSSHVPYEARRQGHEQSPSLTQSKDTIIADFRHN